MKKAIIGILSLILIADCGRQATKDKIKWMIGNLIFGVWGKIPLKVPSE